MSQQGSRQQGYSTEPPHSSAVPITSGSHLAVTPINDSCARGPRPVSSLHFCSLSLLCCRRRRSSYNDWTHSKYLSKVLCAIFVRQRERKMDSESEMDRQTGGKESGSEGSCWAHAARITDCMLWLSVSVWVCMYLMCPHKRSKLYQLLQAMDLGRDRNCQYWIFSF